MTPQDLRLSPAFGSPAPARNISPADLVRDLGPVLLVLIVLLSWVGVEPFPDLASDTLLDADKAAGLLNMAAYLTLGAAAAFTLLVAHKAVLRVLAAPVPLMVTGWLLVATVTSQDPSLSARRLTLSLIVMVLAASILVLPRTLRQFAGLLAGLSLVVLIASFAGVWLAPQVSVHQISDAIEPKLHGDWRGIFAHKNVAAPMMVMFIFVGLLLARVVDRALGLALVVLAAIFLWGAAGKTSMAILPLSLVLAWGFTNTRNLVLRGLIAAVPVIVLNLGTVGSITFPLVNQINEAILPDASFTGRTDIWQFALQKLQQRPLLGYGYQAFWQTSATRFAVSDAAEGGKTMLDESTSSADHAHNAYLDVALTTGLPGLALTIAWINAFPVWALGRARDNGAPEALLLFFTRIWLFGINFACLESLYFNRTDPVWFMLLMAIFGISTLTRFGVKA